MANRVTPLTQIESLSGNISAATYFDNNIGPAMTSLNDSSLGYVNAIQTDAGSANAYNVTCLFGSPSAYNQGMEIKFIPANTNTGASTITVTPLTSVAIQDAYGNAIPAGFISAGRIVSMVFIGTAFRIESPSVTGGVPYYYDYDDMVFWSSATNARIMSLVSATGGAIVRDSSKRAGHPGNINYNVTSTSGSVVGINSGFAGLYLDSGLVYTVRAIFEINGLSNVNCYFGLQSVTLTTSYTSAQCGAIIVGSPTGNFSLQSADGTTAGSASFGTGLFSAGVYNVFQVQITSTVITAWVNATLVGSYTMVHLPTVGLTPSLSILSEGTAVGGLIDTFEILITDPTFTVPVPPITQRFLMGAL